MKGMVKCVICGDQTDPENPLETGAIYAPNPLTFRKAWMCGLCYLGALDDAFSMPASSVEYENRLDEYNSKFEL